MKQQIRYEVGEMVYVPAETIAVRWDSQMSPTRHRSAPAVAYYKLKKPEYCLVVVNEGDSGLDSITLMIPSAEDTWQVSKTDIYKREDLC